MQAKMVYPANGDVARLEIILSDHDINKARNGEKLQIESWVGGGPDDQLPVVLAVFHESHQPE